jgi:hypothetical protein
MKKIIKLLSFLTVAGFMLASCEGPMGPAGADGAPGADGKDGIDANESCTLCHNSNAVIETKVAQWENSIHATGGNAGYCNRSGCLQCHTSQGFLQAVATGSTSNLTVPIDPQQINCYTCHKIHDTFTDDDWALTKPTAQVLDVQYNGANVTWDKGNSNQCVQCHQARPISTAPTLDGSDFVITSSGTRISQHHSPTPNLILGKNAFEMPGTVEYPTTNPHSSDKGCISCHMATPYGYVGGGHSWNMMYESHETETLLSTGCLVCHTTYTATTIATKLATLQGEVEEKIADLEAQLIDAGVYDTTTELAKAGTFNSRIVYAYIIFDTVVQDRSGGMHNPGYIKALLDNTIAEMTTLGYPPPA